MIPVQHKLKMPNIFCIVFCKRIHIRITQLVEWASLWGLVVGSSPTPDVILKDVKHMNEKLRIVAKKSNTSVFITLSLSKISWPILCIGGKNSIMLKATMLLVFIQISGALCIMSAGLCNVIALIVNPRSTIPTSVIVLQAVGSAFWSTYGIMTANHFLTLSSMSSFFVQFAAFIIKICKPVQRVRILNDSTDTLPQF